MAKEFDPNNLSGGDVLKSFASIVIVVTIVVLIGRYAPEYAWLLVLIAPVGIYIWITNLPRKDLEVIAQKEIELDKRIGGVPVVGRPFRMLWKAINWAGIILGAGMLIMVTIAGVSKLL